MYRDENISSKVAWCVGEMDRTCPIIRIDATRAWLDKSFGHIIDGRGLMAGRWIKIQGFH